MMKTGFFSLLLAASSASAFSPQDTSRRQFLGGVASTASTGIAVVLSQPLSALAADAAPSFSGIFTDPNHPQGWRAVREENGVAILQLQDEPGAEIFTIKGDVKKGAGSGTTLMLDLSPKGGPKDVPATVSEGKISFPDGNSWKRLDGVDGVYSDPNHPEGYRIVRKTAKDAVSVTLQDAPGAPVVTVIGSVSGDKIKLDLSPKGGPKDLVASIGANKITFPDGNSWPKL
mmetsp:Transcript_34737/g.77966  ORF Transcript_34737/g.77966 Transcript_34737/m.77966 type:complete len:230 (-) Transcript_34737:13-702(-)